MIAEIGQQFMPIEQDEVDNESSLFNDSEDEGEGLTSDCSPVNSKIPTLAAT